MNNRFFLSFVFLFLGGILLISTAFFLPSQNKRLLTASLYTPPQCPFHVGLTPNQVKTNSELSLKQEAILLKLFFTQAVLDSRGVAICKETDSLNTCLARFQNLCYQQGKCEEQYDGSKDATLTLELQAYLCTIWSQRYTKIFDSWTKVTSLFAQKNTSVPSWLSSSRSSYLSFRSQQTTTTTTTTLPTSSFAVITFPKVSQRTIFVYPDPDIIKSIIPADYDYFPRIDLWNSPGANSYPPYSNKPVWEVYQLNMPAQIYTLISSGTSRQFRAVVVYPDGTHTDPLDTSRIQWSISKIGRCNIWGDCLGWTNDSVVECTVSDSSASVLQCITDIAASSSESVPIQLKLKNSICNIVDFIGIHIPSWCYEYPAGYIDSRDFNKQNLEQLLSQIGVSAIKFRLTNDTVANCRLNDTKLEATYGSDKTGYCLTPQQKDELNGLIHKIYPYFDNFHTLVYNSGIPVKTIQLQNNGITVDKTGKVTINVPFTSAIIKVADGTITSSFLVVDGVSRYAGFGTPCGVTNSLAGDFFTYHDYGTYGKGLNLCGTNYTSTRFENGSFYDAIVMLPKSQGTFSSTWINYQGMPSTNGINYDLNYRGLGGLWVFPWNSGWGSYQVPIKLNINTSGSSQSFKVSVFSLSDPARIENIPISWNQTCPVPCNK